MVQHLVSETTLYSRDKEFRSVYGFYPIPCVVYVPIQTLWCTVATTHSFLKSWLAECVHVPRSQLGNNHKAQSVKSKPPLFHFKIVATMITFSCEWIVPSRCVCPLTLSFLASSSSFFLKWSSCFFNPSKFLFNFRTSSA